MNQKKIQEMFRKAHFVNDLGIELGQLGSGNCETRLKIGQRHLQQTEVVHAGVLATLADHTAGGAVASLLQDDQFVLTAEFKISLFRAAKAQNLRCLGRVLKQGRTLAFAEAEVFDVYPDQEILVAKACVTLAVLTESAKSGTS